MLQMLWCPVPNLLRCHFRFYCPAYLPDRRKEEHIVFLVLGGWGVGIWGATKVGARAQYILHLKAFHGLSK